MTSRPVGYPSATRFLAIVGLLAVVVMAAAPSSGSGGTSGSHFASPLQPPGRHYERTLDELRAGALKPPVPGVRCRPTPPRSRPRRSEASIRP